MANQRLKIVLLEDNRDDRELVLHELHKMGFEIDVTIATDRESFEKALEQGLLELVLADYNLPSFDGHESLRTLRASFTEVPYILVSGFIGEETAVELLKAGATDVVMKTNLQRLGPAIKRALQERALRQEREDAVSDLREQVNLIQELQDSIPSPVFYKDTRGIYEGCNDAFAELMGTDREQIIGSRAEDFMAPDLVDFVNSTDREVLVSRAAKRHEYALSAPDGELRDFIYHKAPVHRSDGSLRGIVGVLLDVTEMKQQSRKLRSSLEMQEAVFNGIDDVILAISASDRTIRLANPAVSEVFGYEPAELVGSSTQILHVDTEHFDRFSRNWDPELEKYGSFRTEYPMRRKDGTSFPAEITVTEQSKQHGWRVGVVSVIRDMSEKKKAEEELRRHQKELEMVLESTPDVMLRIDNQQRIVYANDAVRTRAELDPDDILGREIAESFRLAGVPEESTEGWNHDMGEVFAKGREVDRVRESKIAGRRIWSDIRLIPEFDADGRVASVLAISRDISDQKRAEVALEEREEQLRQAQRMESIGRLAGGVAHDFNNILTAIGGYIHMALNSLDETHPARTGIENVRGGIERAARLTQQLLLFSRKAPSEMNRFDLNGSVRNMLKMLGRLISENISVESNLDEESLWILGDEGKIDQVIMNLVLNARDAMSGGGRITITTTREEKQALLEISDTGEGMDETTLDKMFEPFFTTKPKESGTGLGLAVVYGIIQEHDGQIEAASTPGEGTTFSISIPLSHEPADKPRGNKEKELEAPAQGQRVLFVEDEQAIAEVMISGLSYAGYEVTGAGDLATARARWEEADGAFDAVVADVVLTDGSGVALLEMLSPATGTSFIFASGYLEDKQEFQELRTGGYRFLHKPYAISTLLATLHDELSEEADHG